MYCDSVVTVRSSSGAGQWSFHHIFFVVLFVVLGSVHKLRGSGDE